MSQHPNAYTLDRLHDLNDYVQLVQILRNRLDDSQVDISFEVLYQLIDRLVVRDTRHASDNVLRGLLDIANESIIRPNQDVMTSLSALPATYNNTPFPQNTTVYYVRSLPLTIEQLHQIMERYHHHYADNLFYESMHAFIQAHVDQPGTQVWIRYVGATSNTTPATRLQDDLDAARVVGRRRFNNFYRTMTDMDIHSQFQVHEIFPLRVQGLFGQRGPNQEVLDATERFLIHLLDRNFLLNSQPGGYFISYQPLAQDQQFIHTINAAYAYDHCTVLRQVQVARREFNQDVVAAFDQYTAQLTQHDEALANSITQQYLQSVYQQFTPHAAQQFQHNNSGIIFTPLVLLGKDVSIHNFSNATSFYNSRSGTVTRDFIDSILSTMSHGEEVEGGDEERELLLPAMIDLWPIPRHRFLWELHINHAATLLDILRPLVLVSFSYEVARVARSNFHGRHSLSREGYRQLAGEARVCNYDTSFNYDTEPEDVEPAQHWCVVVYHNDPGNANYGSVNPIITRFMHLCWVRTIILLNTCLDFLQHPNLVTAAPGSRTFSEQVLAASASREPDQLSTSLQEARDALNEYRANDARDKHMTFAIRNEGVLDARNHEMVAAVSTATLRRRIDMWGISAPAGSDERVQQYVSIIRHDYPDLYSSPSFTHNRAAFRNWFIYVMNDNINILQSFLRHVQEETTPTSEGLPPGLVRYLLQVCQRPPEWPLGDDTWINVKELRDIAMEGARQRFVDRNGAPMGRAQDPQVSRQLRNQYLESIGNVPYHRFNMCELHVGSRKARFRVVVDGEQRHETNGLYVGQAIQACGPTVYIDFDPQVTRHGLVFKNEAGQLLPSARNPTIIYDYTLVQHAKNSYFRVFVDTLGDHNIQPRQQVMEEAGIDEPFSLKRILRPYWMLVCRDDVHDVYLRAEDVPGDEQDQPNFTTEITDYINEHGRGIDRLVWMNYIEDTRRGMVTISCAWKDLLKHYNLALEDISMIRGIKRWRIPAYPGEDAMRDIAVRGSTGQVRTRARSRSAQRYTRPLGYRARGSRSTTPGPQ